MSSATDQSVQRMLEEAGALKRGHFALSSGLHSDRYCQCATLFERPDLAERVARVMLDKLPPDFGVDVVLAPALGGILWGYELARALASRGGSIRSFFAERNAEGQFSLRRGFELARGQRVLLAEDVVTTGGSVMELAPLVEQAGARIAGFAVIADRSRGKFQPPGGAQLFALTTLEFETFDPGQCPMCRAGKPVEKPGSRK